MANIAFESRDVVVDLYTHNHILFCNLVNTLYRDATLLDQLYVLTTIQESTHVVMQPDLTLGRLGMSDRFETVLPNQSIAFTTVAGAWYGLYNGLRQAIATTYPNVPSHVSLCLYKLEDPDGLRIIDNKTVVANHLDHAAHITGLTFIGGVPRYRLVRMVQVRPNDEMDSITYHPFNDNSKPLLELAKPFAYK